MLGFRVWDVRNNRFDEHEVWNICTDGTINHTMSPPIFIPMQSTGIRAQGYFIDKAAYDFIYEGDIVKVECPDINHSYIFEVKCIPSFFVNLPYGQIKFTISVLGNKYQHPELLEQTC